MLEDVKQSFFRVDNERKLFQGKIDIKFLCCCSPKIPGTDDSELSIADEKNKAVQRASTLEEKIEALQEENAALKLAADAERSQKDRLLAVVHTLTGLLKSSCNPRKLLLDSF